MSKLLTKFKFKFERFVKNIFSQTQIHAQNISAIKVEAARPINLVAEYQVSQQEYDVFKMKAIVLLKKDDMPAASLQSLLKDQIQVRVGTGENQKVVIKLSQRFEWSGRVYQLEGEFLRDPTKKMHSIPLAKTFKITQSLIQ